MKSIKVDNLRRYGDLSFGLADINPTTKLLTKAATLSSCRAYMADSLFTLKNKDKTTRGHGYLEAWYPWQKGHTYVLVEVPDNHLKHFLSNLGFLHAKEEKAGVAKSKVFKVELKDTKNMFLVKGSGHWKNKCWSMLLYTFYIKCMVVENPTAINLNGEKYYWDALRKHDSDGVTNEDKLLKSVKMRKEIFSTEVFGNKLNTGVHDREGFVSICTGKNPPMSKLLKLNTGVPDDWFKKNITVVNW